MALYLLIFDFLNDIMQREFPPPAGFPAVPCKRQSRRKDQNHSNMLSECLACCRPDLFLAATTANVSL